MPNIWLVTLSLTMKLVRRIQRLTNVYRGILHDEKVYFRPFSFNPERFLSSDGSPRDDILDPRNFVFGLGRRYILLLSRR